jgi:hypothetical protein
MKEADGHMARLALRRRIAAKGEANRRLTRVRSHERLMYALN